MSKSIVLAALTVVVFASASLFSAEPTHRQQSGAATSAEASTPANIYKSHGVIKGWSPKHITIAHEAITEMNWPAMTMGFDVAEDFVAAPRPIDTTVDFSFRQTEQGSLLIDITPVLTF